MFAIDYYNSRPEIKQQNLLLVSYGLQPSATVNKSRMLQPIGTLICYINKKDDHKTSIQSKVVWGGRLYIRGAKYVYRDRPVDCKGVVVRSHGIKFFLDSLSSILTMASAT